MSDPPAQVPPPPGEIHLWMLDLRCSSEELREHRRLLTPEECRRADRFHFDRHRRRFTVRRAQLRRLLGAYLDLDPRQVRFETGEREKPYLVPEQRETADGPLQWNLSDSEDVAVVGFKVGVELGVDVEVVRPVDDASAISRRFFSAGEQKDLESVPEADLSATFFRCWTRKEAYIKAVGQGLHHPLDSFRVTLKAGEPARFLGFDGLPGEEKHWTLYHLEPDPGIFVAVAVREKVSVSRICRV